MSPPNDPNVGLDVARQIEQSGQLPGAAPAPPMPTDPAVVPAPGLASATTEPASPPAPPEPTASHALLGRLLGKTRKTQVGRMVNRYQSPTVSTAVNRLHQDLRGLAQEGEPGRMWYEKSSKRILDYVQGNRDEAHKIAQLIAIYSPQTTVPVNTSNAIKAYNRAKAGQTMWAGDILDRDKSFDTIKGASDHAKALEQQYGGDITKVPLDDSGKRFLFARHNMAGYENIATADRDLKAHLLMNEGLPFEGRKTNNFYRNLMVHIDPTIDQGSTQDLWMARAFGFHDDAVSNATKYDFMEKLTHKLGVELGWKPHQVQAAIWTAMKTRQEAVKDDVMKEALANGMASMVPGTKGKPNFEVKPGQEDAYASLMRDRALEKVLDPDHIRRSARDFSDFLDQHLAQVPWESTPSRDVGHLAGLSDLAPHKRADYHKRISEALQDEHGNDLLAQHLGMLSPGTVEAPGYWQGDSNPASHLNVATTRIKAAEQRPDIDTASKELLDTYANARGLLLKQDGVGYYRPHFDPQVTRANGMEYKLDQGLSAAQIKDLGSFIDKIPNTAFIPKGPDKFHIVHLGVKDPITPLAKGIPLSDHRKWHKQVDQALQNFHSGAITADWRVFGSDGELRDNDWKENPNGEDYIQRLSAAGRSDVLRFVSDVLAPKVEAVDKAFAKEHGLKRDERLEKSIRGAGSQEGVDLLRGLGRPRRAAGGAIDMGSTPYSVDMANAPGGTAQRGMDVARAALAGSGGGGGDAPAPGSGRDFLNQLANDPKTDGMTRLFAAGMAKSGTFSGQDPSTPAPAVVDPNAKPDYPVNRADGGPVGDPQRAPELQGIQEQSPAASPSYIKPVDENARKLSPLGLYSHAADEVWKQPQLKASPQQFKAMLTKKGVKPDEFKWSGYDQAFAGRDFVSKKEVRDHFVRNLPKIQETVKGGVSSYSGPGDTEDDPAKETKYRDYQLPGGRNYREVVLHLPKKTKEGLPSGYKVKHVSQFTPEERRLHGNGPYTVFGPATGGGNNMGSFGSGTTEAGAISRALNHEALSGGANYQSSHWDEPNPLLHLRMADRKGSKGEKILHVEELQSDWGQEGKKQGFKQPMTPEDERELQELKARNRQSPLANDDYDRMMDLNRKNVGQGLPPAPYVDTTKKWTQLGLKRVLHEAAKGGYDKVVVTPGEEQAKRYDLSQHVDKVNLLPDPSGQHRIEAYKDNKKVLEHFAKDEQGIAAAVGKEVAEKLLASRNQHGAATVAGQDLKVGGEGMKGYYDKMVPEYLQDLARQHDPEVRVQLHAHELPPKNTTSRDYEVIARPNGTFRILETETGDFVGPAFQGARQAQAHANELGGGNKPVKAHALDITPKMRASILAGQRGYAAGGRIAERIHDDIYKKARKVVMTAGSYP